MLPSLASFQATFLNLEIIFSVVTFSSPIHSTTHSKLPYVQPSPVTSLLLRSPRMPYRKLLSFLGVFVWLDPSGIWQYCVFLLEAVTFSFVFWEVGWEVLGLNSGLHEFVDFLNTCTTFTSRLMQTLFLFNSLTHWYLKAVDIHPVPISQTSLLCSGFVDPN
jgi:hypothetical protein